MSASTFFGTSQAVQLLRQDGTMVSAAEALRDKRYVLVYFSAHWCPPCRSFTPQLKQFYERHHESKNFEVIFMSLDNSDQEMKSYFREAHGNWLCVPFTEARTMGQDWMGRYGCRFIPTLMVFEQPEAAKPLANGEEHVTASLSSDPHARVDGSSRVLVTLSGRAMVPRDPDAESFPWVNADAEMAQSNQYTSAIRNVVVVAIVVFFVWKIMT